MTGRLRINREILSDLEQAKQALREFLDSESTRCAVSIDARKASAPYLNAWVLTYLSDAIGKIKNSEN